MGAGGHQISRCSSSSSGEEDGDADWRAAIDSVATTANFVRSATRGPACTSNGSAIADSIGHPCEEDEVNNSAPKHSKHYQIQAQKLLDNLLEKTIEMVRDPIEASDENPVGNEGGIQLFKCAPHGIVFDHFDRIERPRKRPKILPGEEIDEKSKKFWRQLQSVAVDGAEIIAAARDACQKSFAKLEAKEAASKAAMKREEERIAELKRIRGERWLPSIAKDLQLNF